MPYYYEILVHTLDQDKVVRRVPTRRDAERVIAELIHSDMVSRSAIRWERRRGLHPWSMGILCGGLTLLTLLVPSEWPRIGLFLILLALTAGFLTSGWKWIAGGTDDR
jgi:hypothetical protein